MKKCEGISPAYFTEQKKKNQGTSGLWAAIFQPPGPAG